MDVLLWKDRGHRDSVLNWLEERNVLEALRCSTRQNLRTLQAQRATYKDRFSPKATFTFASTDQNSLFLWVERESEGSERVTTLSWGGGRGEGERPNPPYFHCNFFANLHDRCLLWGHMFRSAFFYVISLSYLAGYFETFSRSTRIKAHTYQKQFIVQVVLSVCTYSKLILGMEIVMLWDSICTFPKLNNMFA